MPVEAQRIQLIDQVTDTPVEYVDISTDNIYLGSSDSLGVVELNQKVDSLCIFHINYRTDCYSRPFPDTVFLYPGIALHAVSVRAPRTSKKMRNIPIQTTLIEPQAPSAQIRLNAADIATSTTGVHVQKSQQGGGSPMIRGFAANRILLVIDGVRMNNAIFRAGNIQNLISIDPHHLSSMRIHMGPHSLLYGSDAIGGVIDMETIRPDHYPNDGIHGTIGGQYVSANQQYSTHALLSYKKKKWSYVGDFQFSQYGDLRMGSHGPDTFLRLRFAQRINNQDTILTNSDSRIQRSSGYQQWNTRHIVGYRLKPDLQIEYGFYRSATSDIPRYDRLIQPGSSSEALRNGDWFYGPQEWTMHRLQLSSDKNFTSTNWSIQLAQQHFTESRNDRRFGSDLLRTRTEDLDAYSLNIDIRSRQDRKFTWTAGAEGIYNIVNSEAESNDIISGSTQAIITRYPDDSRWFAAGVYAQAGLFINSNLGLSGGFRYTRTGIRAKVDRQFIDLPVVDLDQNTGAVSTSLGLNYSVHKNWTSSITLSNAFRAPNIDDAAKVFDSEPGTVLVPNVSLNPEYSYSVELGLRKVNGAITGRVNLFYSWINNILDRAPTQLMGQDSIVYDGTLSQIFSVQNLQNGTVYGVETELSWDISDQLKWNHQFSYQQGSESTKEGTFPLRHVTPMLYRTEVKYNQVDWTFILNWIWSGALQAEDIALSERAKPYLYDLDDQGRPFSPSWNDLSTSVHYTHENITLQLGVFNLFDRRYRTYSSGIAAPGRGVSIGFNYDF